LIISCSGTLGKVSIINKDDPKGIISQALLILRPNIEIIDTKYLYFFLSSPKGFQSIVSVSSGSVQTNIAKRSIIENIDVLLPSITNQIAIARILSSLDDKIALNNRINKKLEEIGQALFKHWFIDFNFPGFNGELVDEIPKGWKKYTITELLDTVSVTHKFPKGKAIFLNTSDILDGIFLHENYSDVSELPGQAKKTIRKGDILFSEIRPANKRYAYVDFEADDYVVSTKLMVLRSKGIANSLVLYFYLKRPEVLSNLQLLAESRSGTFPQITYSELSKIEMNIPDEKTLSQYNEVIHSIFSKIRINQNENSSLIRIRDTLLPKLMSGEISVKDIC